MDTEIPHIFDIITEPENRLVCKTSFQLLAYFTRTHFKEGKMSLRFLDEQTKPQLLAFKIQPFSPLFEECNYQLQSLTENGLTKTLFNRGHRKVQYRNDDINDDVPPLVLNMEDLGIGFLVCLVPLTLTFVAFVCELATPLMKALVKATLDRLSFLYLIRIVAKMRLGQP